MSQVTKRKISNTLSETFTNWKLVVQKCKISGLTRTGTGASIYWANCLLLYLDTMSAIQDGTTVAPSNAFETIPGSVVDCRNQLCPKPIIMTKKALAEASLGQVLEIIVNDKSSKTNVLKYCWNHGQGVIRSYYEGRDFHVLVKKSPEKKVETPVPVIGPCGARWD